VIQTSCPGGPGTESVSWSVVRARLLATRATALSSLTPRSLQLVPPQRTPSNFCFFTSRQLSFSKELPRIPLWILALLAQLLF